MQEQNNEHVKAYDVFISYAREDEENAARPLAEALRARGFRVWLDRFVLDGGGKVEDTILEGLQGCYCPVVILSKDFLRKEWPKKELDILLALEEIDDRYRIVTVRHAISDAELRASSPYLAQRTVIATTEGMPSVCDHIIQVATEYAMAGARQSEDVDASIPLAKFCAPGAVKCPNEKCSWELPREAAQIELSDPGPEFTLTRKHNQWYIACGSCGTLAAGPLDRSEAKWILTFVRMHIYAPEHAPYLQREK